METIQKWIWDTMKLGGTTVSAITSGLSLRDYVVLVIFVWTTVWGCSEVFVKFLQKMIALFSGYVFVN